MRLFSFNTPPTPPTAKEDDLLVLRLIRSRRVGPATFHRMIDEYGSAQAALAALPEVARQAGVSGYEACPEGVAAAELRAGRRLGARLLRWDDPAYPAHLRGIADAPPLLWVRGNVALLSRPCVALIGARNASSLGLRLSRGLATGLAEAGIVVVSGLARGIDTAAHQAALATGTVAVMPGGIDVIYPPENEALAAAIAEQGLLVTEQPPGTAPTARHFPLRNRIISGLSLAVVVTEAAHRSGSLLTAKNALDQGREVLAVPGHPMDARAAGGNGLIRDGATLIRNTDDIIAAIAHLVDLPEPAPDSGPEPAPEPAPAPAPEPQDLAGRILRLLGPSPTDENMLIRDLGLPAARILPALLELELAGQILRSPGGRLSLPG